SDCGYGEGRDAYWTACHPCRYKSSWGHHRCQACITCAVINHVLKANCTATNAICGDCLPRFYHKTRIGGLQDQECIPCTKQTPTSEVQCAFQLSLVKADARRVHPQGIMLVALVSGLLVVFTLVFGLFFFYYKQFFNKQCQQGKDGCFTFHIPGGFLLHFVGGSLQFEADKAVEKESLFPLPPDQETIPKSSLSESTFETQPLNPILDDDYNSTHGFSTQESFTVISCASKSYFYWLHTPTECTELDLQTFFSSASYTAANTLGGTLESSGGRLETNVPFEVPSP
uniref:Ectodysplasin A2 receptor n=1 Tax=Loxodonta africana TaxID=9785 RepID=G3U6D2_LOXAF